MITLKNFPDLLVALGFEEDKASKIYSKYFKESKCTLKVDFAKEQMIYPAGVKIGRETTTNFSANENFVVFECVCRLLEKGYKPSDIYLEKPIPGGHGDAAGWADIIISKTEENGESQAFIIVECKKADEFDKFWKITLSERSQLFNYYNNFQSAKWLCMYTSDFVSGKPIYRTTIIPLEDNEEYLKTDSTLISYRSCKGKDNFAQRSYDVWKNTYDCDYSEEGLLEEEIQPYYPGKRKYSVSDLQEIDEGAIQKKYNEFATILRKYNVSGRENAFDKLVNLLLAKVIDEVNNPLDLDFYWKGTAYDDDFKLQDRLLRLYRDGMERFLDEKITYIENSAIDDAFRFVRSDPDGTKSTILDYFRKLKYFSNNDFSFIEVHNETLFKQNSVVLKEVVRMFENIKLKTEK